MQATWRRWLVPGFLLAVALSLGCNMLSTPFFLMAPDPKIEPILDKVADEKDKDKEVKVAILTYSGVEIRPELFRADRDLTDNLARELDRRCKENKEKVKLISPRKVEEWKNQHTSWKDMELEDIGKDLHADKVIYLEVEELELYQPKSFSDLFQGRVKMSVQLVDVTDSSKTSSPKIFECIYPNESKGGAVEVDHTTGSVSLFRETFLRHVANHLSWYFTSHTQQEDQKCE